MNSPSSAANWIFDCPAFTQMLRSLAYPEEIVEVLLKGVESLHTEEKRSAFFMFREAWLAGSQDEVITPDPTLWHALAIASAFPALFELHRERNIPWEVTSDTLFDLPRRMRHYHEVRGEWGFDAQVWMRSHIRGRLFQIGRLQYGIGKFYYGANVYAHGSKRIALARPGIACNTDGWPGNEGSTWSTDLVIREGLLHGHAVRPDGSLEQTLTAIPADSRCLLDSDSNVLHIHIPMGSKLDIDACRDSLARAFPFFERHFPEQQWSAICCGSWLLDPALAEFKPSPSNIVAFGRLFPSRLTCPGATERSHFRWIFGKGIDRENTHLIPTKTRLQQAMLDYLNAGGSLRIAAGYLLPEDLR